MARRWEPPVVEKAGLSHLQPYDNWRECRTVAELDAIAENPNAIHMEGLCIRERILGRPQKGVEYTNTRNLVLSRPQV
jgi:Fem-1 family protein b